MQNDDGAAEDPEECVIRAQNHVKILHRFVLRAAWAWAWLRYDVCYRSFGLDLGLGLGFAFSLGFSFGLIDGFGVGFVSSFASCFVCLRLSLWCGLHLQLRLWRPRRLGLASVWLLRQLWWLRPHSWLRFGLRLRFEPWFGLPIRLWRGFVSSFVSCLGLVSISASTLVWASPLASASASSHALASASTWASGLGLVSG